MKRNLYTPPSIELFELNIEESIAATSGSFTPEADNNYQPDVEDWNENSSPNESWTFDNF